MLQINDRIAIPDELIRIRYVRSAGPGGQNVNKVNTRAQLTFNLGDCTQIPLAARKRAETLAGRRLTNDGFIVMESDRFRHQYRNRRECLNRLRLLVRKALIPPRKRLPTQPTAASKRKRLADKRRRGTVKSLRRTPSPDD